MKPPIKLICRTVMCFVISALLGACATNWTHPQIQDKAASARQLIIDDGYCTMVSTGSAPMPPASQNNASASTSYVTGTTSTYNSSTGQRTNGTYAGQITTTPSGGFAGGFSSGFNSGVNTGSAIAAAFAQERIYNGCMANRGWIDGDKSIVVAQTPKSIAPLSQPPSPPAYSDSNQQSKADIDEFLNFHPRYNEKNLYALLDKRVKTIVNNKSTSIRSQDLLAAQDQLVQEGLIQSLSDDDPNGLRAVYIAAVRGDAKQQNALALAYIQRKDQRTPFNPKRAEYWSRESALKGNSIGQLGYGITLFQLGERVNGYRWVEYVANRGIDTGDNLSRFRAGMTKDELLIIQKQ